MPHAPYRDGGVVSSGSVSYAAPWLLGHPSERACMAVLLGQVRDFARLARASEPRPDVRAGEETARQVIDEEETRAERLADLSRLLAAFGGLVVAAAWKLSGTAPPGIGLVTAALAVICLYAI